MIDGKIIVLSQLMSRDSPLISLNFDLYCNDVMKQPSQPGLMTTAVFSFELFFVFNLRSINLFL